VLFAASKPGSRLVRQPQVGIRGTKTSFLFTSFAETQARAFVFLNGPTSSNFPIPLPQPVDSSLVDFFFLGRPRARVDAIFNHQFSKSILTTMRSHSGFFFAGA